MIYFISGDDNARTHTHTLFTRFVSNPSCAGNLSLIFTRSAPNTSARHNEKQSFTDFRRLRRRFMSIIIVGGGKMTGTKLILRFHPSIYFSRESVTSILWVFWVADGKENDEFRSIVSIIHLTDSEYSFTFIGRLVSMCLNEFSETKRRMKAV